MTKSFLIVTPVLALCLIFIQSNEAHSQPPQQIPMGLPPGAVLPPGVPPPGSPPGNDKQTDANKSDKKASESATINRPLKPEQVPDPAELKILPNAEGKIRFNFVGQSWPGVMEWLAEVSHLSLDWQELPSDFLNLRTQREYTIPEAQDLINRHLLSRGFTMLIAGEMLTVVNVSKLNPALIPRVEPEDLKTRSDYEFVKVSFSLDWMLAEQAVEEFKPMLSPNGKLSSLKGVNRIEAIDAAINLKEIYQVIEQELSREEPANAIIREFKLQHRRANEVAMMLEKMLGLDQKKPMGAGNGRNQDQMSAHMMQQMQQQMQQMQQQMMQQQQGGAAAKSENDPKLVVNERENSILANATPDKMEIIKQMIQAIDVPTEGPHPLANQMQGVRTYRLSTLDPLPLVEILSEMGGLSPQSRIQTDEKNRALIVFGTIADHLTVKTLVERLDGSNRSFEVIPLRKVRAESIAGTIQYLLGADDQDKNKNNNNNRGFYGYFPSMPQQSSEEDKRPFKVDADLEHNRLLVWANEVEMKEVYNLLEKMGEILPGSSNPETVRTLELSSDEDAEALLKRVQELWPAIDANPLQIQGGPRTQAPAREPTDSAPAQNSAPSAMKETSPFRFSFLEKHNTEPNHSNSEHPIAQFTQPVEENLQFFSSDTPQDNLQIENKFDLRQSDSAANAPIQIRRAPNGRIIIGSEDTRALDQLEELMQQLAPPPKNYRVFQLRYPNTWAIDIELILKDFFKNTEDQETRFDPFWGMSYSARANKTDRLSKQKELKIISDEASKTILVQGATPQQLVIIEDLIRVYDRPSSSDPQSVRLTKVFHLTYSQAETVTETLKQVYRDLLSANDPALQGNNNNENQQRNVTYSYSYGSGSDSSSSKSSSSPLRFKGLLSIGADEVSNTVVVSAGSDLMEQISQLIKQLDEAANPRKTFQVMQLQNTNTAVLKERLDTMFQPSLKTSQTGSRKKDPNQNHILNQNGNGNQQ